MRVVLEASDLPGKFPRMLLVRGRVGLLRSANMEPSSSAAKMVRSIYDDCAIVHVAGIGQPSILFPARLPNQLAILVISSAFSANMLVGALV